MSPALTRALTQAAHRQSRSARDLALACCAYLLLFSGGTLLWLAWSGVALDAWVLAGCSLPPLAGLALACQSRADARQYTLHLMAALLGLPILLLFWAGSLDAEPPPAAPGLDAQALFSGADAVQDTELRSGGILLLRSGRFADGTELRLSRHADEQAAQAYLAMLEQAMPTEAFTDGGRRGLRLSGPGVGGTLVMVEQHGPDLLELRAPDRASALARLAAQRVAPPQPTPASTPIAQWPFYTGMALGHALVFVALILWAGAHLTRVPALAGVPVATADELRARLMSLARPAGPFDITAPAPQALRVQASRHPLRSHHITLQLDAAAHAVHVHEALSIRGDAPRDADEASLRHVGDDLLDASRPDARQLWSSVRQATLIVPSRLAAVPLRLQPGQAALPADYAATLDGEGQLTALCALVTRSGWHWQPRLLGRRG